MKNLKGLPSSITTDNVIISKRLCYAEYSIEYREENGSKIAYIVGKTKISYRKELFKDFNLLDSILRFCFNLKFIEPLCLQIMGFKETIDGKKVRNDEDYKKIYELLFEYCGFQELLFCYGLSTKKEDNQFYNILCKLCRICRIYDTWSNILSEKDLSSKSLNFKLLFPLNKNINDSPIKFQLYYFKEHGIFVNRLYMSSILSIVSLNMIQAISHKDYKICRYCNDFFYASDKRLTWCGKPECKTEKRRREKAIDRERDANIERLFNEVMNKLDDTKKQYFLKRYEELCKLKRRRKGTKNFMIIWLTQIRDTGRVW